MPKIRIAFCQPSSRPVTGLFRRLNCGLLPLLLRKPAVATGRLKAHAFCVSRIILTGCVIFTHARVIFTPGTETGGTEACLRHALIYACREHLTRNRWN